MNTISIRQNARLNFLIKRADNDAISATFKAVNGSTVITDTIDYDSGGKAYFVFNEEDTGVLGEYEYQVSENFTAGSPDIYPDPRCGCGLPKLIICKSL